MTVAQRVARRVPENVRPPLAGLYHAARANPLYTAASKRRLAHAIPPDHRDLLESAQHAVSPHDTMASGGCTHYFRVGLDAVRCIDAALAATGTPQPSAVLDMPCGWGRVMRFLAVRMPAASLTACDIVDDAIMYCARRFGARPVLSSSSFDDVDVGGRFDLVWCGSLVTHIDAAGINGVLRLLARSLEPNGLALVTAHGRAAARRLRDGDAMYGLDHETTGGILAAYEDREFGFAELAASAPGSDPARAPYGVSLTSRSWMRAAAERAGLRETHFAEHGWDEHQDVYGFVLDGARPRR
jgi:SAM-dependent methyltransferase